MASKFRFPGPTNRTAIVGSTGSGKSQFATWLLSTRNILDRPWVIMDPKCDDLIAELPARELGAGDKPPKQPGLYVMHPLPDVHDVWVENFMQQVWAQEDVGLYIDEGYMIPRNSRGLRALLTQGRSKHIEMIILSQRPTWCHPMIFSESDFLSVFRLNKPEDREKMEDAMSMNIEKRLPPYHSYWYDVGRNQGFTMGPVPERDQIIGSFRRFAQRTLKVI